LESHIQEFLTSLAAQSSYSKSTLAAYASDLRIFTAFLYGNFQRHPLISDFNTSSVTAFLEQEQSSGRQPRTLLRRRAALQRFEKYLASRGLISKTFVAEEPWTGNQATSHLLDGEPPVTLSGEDVIQLFRAFDSSSRILARRDHAVLALLLDTGLSVSNLLALDLSDLDLRAGKLHLQDSQGEDCWLGLGSALEPLDCYVNQVRPELNPSPDEPALFVSQNGVRMSRQSIWQVLQHWGKMAGLETALSPRILRHTAAVRLTSSGRPQWEMQILLGHRNPLSTQALLHRLNTGHPSPQDIDRSLIP
jgi:site-specific recombinase XerD